MLLNSQNCEKLQWEKIFPFNGKDNEAINNVRLKRKKILKKIPALPISKVKL